MAGNVLQWTNDWDGAYPEGPATDPAGPAKGTVRVLRGGSWAVTGGAVRVSSRYSYEPAGAADTIGFRCVIDAGSS
jgi:sulfatase modifying factor 1